MLIEARKSVTAIAIRDIVSGAVERKRMLIKIYEDHNDNIQKLIGKEYTEDTWSKHDRIMGYIKEFLQSGYGRKDINIHSIDLESGKGFCTWLRVTRECSHNTAAKYVSMFKKDHYCL